MKTKPINSPECPNNGWIKSKNKQNLACAAASNGLESACMWNIHQFSGHPGVHRTLYLVRMVSPRVLKAAVREVIKNCNKCQSIDPTPVHWKIGWLDMHKNWSRVGMDMIHFGGQYYLMLLDCSPSQFANWWLLLHQDSASFIQQLETVFFKRGLPVELLTDDSMVFYGEMFTKFAEVLGIQRRFWCTYIPSDNGILERSHCTINHIAARSQCSILEAVCWYNMTLKKDSTASTAPANSVQLYQANIKGIDVVPACEHTDPGIFKVR